MPEEMDMSEEKAPVIKKLLPEGKRKFTIIGCEKTTSKAGNQMYVFDMSDDETGYVDKIYAITEKGKRWLLKNILDACGNEAAQDGVYKWDIPDVLNKKVVGEVIHEPNTYINRNGDEITTTQHKIVKFEAQAWDE